MADQDSWYDLEWKTTDGINFILTKKGILLQYQSKNGISLQSEFSFMWWLCYKGRMKDFAFVSPQYSCYVIADKKWTNSQWWRYVKHKEK